LVFSHDQEIAVNVKDLITLPPIKSIHLTWADASSVTQQVFALSSLLNLLNMFKKLDWNNEFFGKPR